MQIVLTDIQTPEWLAHMKPDGKRSTETLILSATRDSFGLKGYIISNGDIRYVLSDLETGEGLSTVTGKEIGHTFRLDGAYTPENKRGFGYAKRLMFEVLKLTKVIEGDKQNTPDGYKLIESVGSIPGVRYFKPETIDQEEYIRSMEATTNTDEIASLRKRAFDVARLEIR